MFFNRAIRLVLCAVSMFLGGGCVATITSSVSPGVALTREKTYLIEHHAKGGEINEVIRAEFAAMNFKVQAGPHGGTVPSNVDYVVTYEDHWFWDITMYLLALEIQVRDPQTRSVVASGRANFSSLARKEAKYVARGVLESIFLKSGALKPEEVTIKEAKP